MFDLECLTYRLKNNNYFVNDVTITPELQERLDEYLDESFTITEKVVYYYIMLAKVLTYDSTFYAHEQRGSAAWLHETPLRTAEITPENNECACYEACALFEKILHNLKVDYEVVKKDDTRYGKEHSSTKFVVHQYIVTGDIMRSAMTGDFFLAKLGLPLNGLRCINQESDTRKLFNDIVKKVYTYINEKTITPNDIKAREYLESLDRKLSFQEKIENMIKGMEYSEHLSVMERMAYLKHLYFMSFSNFQLSANVNMVVAREQVGIDRYMPIALFVTHPKKISSFSEENIYFGFDSDFTFHNYSHAELQELFDSHKYEYLSYPISRAYAGSYNTLEGINAKRKLPW